MAANVSGKIGFVTGGASGIGAVLTTKLVDGAAEDWIADRQIGPAQELVQRLTAVAQMRRDRVDARAIHRLSAPSPRRRRIRADRLPVQQCGHWGRR